MKTVEVRVRIGVNQFIAHLRFMKLKQPWQAPFGCEDRGCEGRAWSVNTAEVRGGLEGEGVTGRLGPGSPFSRRAYA